MTSTDLSAAAPAPVRWWRTFGRLPRIMGLDVARALALLGMVGAHLGVGGLVDGRSSILFAVLAGVSVALMTGRTQVPESHMLPVLRLRLLGRGAAIFVIGVALEALGTPIAVILTVYGLLYVAAIPFLRWSATRLLIAAGVLAVAAPPLLAGLHAVNLAASAPGLDLVLFGTYPITVWLALMLGGMALGRLRLDRVRAAVWMLVVGVVLAAIGYGVGALAEGQGGDDTATDSYSSFSYVDDADAGKYGVPAEEFDFGGKVCDDWGGGEIYCYADGGDEVLVDDEGELGVDEEQSGWTTYPTQLAEQQPGVMMFDALVAVYPHSGGTAEIVGSGGFAVVVIALCLLVTRWLRWVLLPLAALGSMPLTGYSAHILVFLVAAGPMAMPFDTSGWWGWFSLAMVAAATVWSMFFGQGPLERLVARAASAMASGARASQGDTSRVSAPASDASETAGAPRP
ncbi:hypothetical protein IM711_11765 [Microbacterium esteraromaticum]|uniref:hypothetical protein n=1 Tax=Microbacterium esteraromaticum TaxID=57043 RepID=UPI003C2E2F92